MTDARPLDRHVRRSGSDYTHAFLQLLPQGQAWPREQGSTLVQTCDGLSEYWGFVDGRAADLLERESDPRKTIELLPEWERAWGLPDPCFPSATTIGERQRNAERRGKRHYATDTGEREEEWPLPRRRGIAAGKGRDQPARQVGRGVDPR